MSGQNRRIPTHHDRPLFVTDDEGAGAAPDDSATRPTGPQRANSPSNQRRSFRCPIQDGCDSALLFASGQRYSVCLIDQSADGFRVSCGGDAPLEPGPTVRLRTLNGEYQVRVVFVNRTDDVTHIGLERLADGAKPSRGSATAIVFLIVALASAALFYWAL
jgi:hypothetical protein